jgi:putative ABC transport system ATP-binding protein
MRGGCVVFQDVVREYRAGQMAVRAADGVTFSLQGGQFAIIVGPSGAGKTTVLNILGGMDTITSGSVSVDGRVISALSAREVCAYRRGDVGFVFQFYNLIPNLTALENVELASHICKDALDPREALADVGLSHREDSFPAQLSGGEQQRVAIARALAKNPKLLLCDEPTGALDYASGKNIFRLLQDTCREKGVTVVVITHNNAVTPIAHRVVKISSGKVVSVIDNAAPASIEGLEW